MLVHVALNQTGFKIPGVAPDARGVLLGKQGAVLLASLDQAVAFFRLLSEESSLDDLLPSLHIFQVRSRLLSQELLVLLHASSSYLLDRCARVAALCGGLTCTGSGRHYVKYRDRAAPLGYDSDELYSEPSDFIIYGDAFVQAYTREREIPFAQLLRQLSPLPLPGGLQRDAATADRELLWLTVRRGLCAPVFSYLWRNRVKASAAIVDDAATPPAGSAREPRSLLASTSDARPSFALVRAVELPERILRLLAALPGIEVYRPLGDNFAVELGFRHPLRLESCASLFDKERLYLFGGQRGTCDVVARPPLCPVESLMRTSLQITEVAAEAPSPVKGARAPAAQQVPLRLVRSASAPRRGTATLVPWARLAWFKQLVYALPPPMLKGYRAAAIDDGLFVICPSGVDGLPIGDLYREAAPSIFVPVGTDLLPRIGPEVLTEQVGGVVGRYLLFLPVPALESAAAPRALALPHSLFESLGRRTLAPLSIETRSSASVGLRARPVQPTSLVNDPLLAAFPLWGFRGEGSTPGDGDR